MFDRYALYEIDTLRDRFALPAGVPKGVKPSYLVTPTRVAPVIVLRDGERQMERMKWGFVRDTAKDDNAVFRYKTFVTKSDTILNKPTWKEAIRERRCIVPVNGFYVGASAKGGKEAYFVRPSSGGVFSLAGVYSTWRDESGAERGMFAVVTTIANKELAALGERTPVILQPSQEATWLDPAANDATTLYDLMRPYPSKEPLEIRRVHQRVLTTKKDSAELLLE